MLNRRFMQNLLESQHASLVIQNNLAPRTMFAVNFPMSVSPKNLPGNCPDLQIRYLKTRDLVTNTDLAGRWQEKRRRQMRNSPQKSRQYSSHNSESMCIRRRKTRLHWRLQKQTNQSILVLPIDC